MKVILKFYDLFRIITSSVKIHLKLRSFQIYIIIVGIGIMRKRCAHVQLEKKNVKKSYVPCTLSVLMVIYLKAAHFRKLGVHIDTGDTQNSLKKRSPSCFFLVSSIPLPPLCYSLVFILSFVLSASGLLFISITWAFH